MASEAVRRWNSPGGMLDFFFPPLCLACGEYTESVDSICEFCRRRFDLFAHPICLGCGQMIDRGHSCNFCGSAGLLLFAFGNYLDPLTEIVIQFKFKGITLPAETISLGIAEQFGERLAAIGVISLVPIPLYPSREYVRGYNQAFLFAEALGRVLNAPVRDDLLIRTQRRRPQASLHHDDRARNIRGVFELDDCQAVEGELVLVDDVVTTGATVFEARRILTAAGCRVPAVIAMAHGL